jgi:hypothetical protein
MKRLNNYSITLMTIAYLQAIGLLPVLQDKKEFNLEKQRKILRYTKYQFDKRSKNWKVAEF